MASPLAKGLFHKAIGESGASFPSGAAADARRRHARRGRSRRREVRRRDERADDRGAARQAGDRPARRTGHAAALVQPERRRLRAARAGVARSSPRASSTRCRCSPAGTPAKCASSVDAAAAEADRGELQGRADATRFGASRRRDGQGLRRRHRRRGARSRRPRWRATASSATAPGSGSRCTAPPSGAKVYRYLFDRDIPIEPGRVQNGTPVTAKDVGARHAGEIEYVFGMLDTIRRSRGRPRTRRCRTR